MLKAAGFRIRYVNFGREPDTIPKLEGYRGLIVLGGPMGVYESDRIPHLKTEMRAIEDGLKRGIPMLGICLGSQLIASVLGAEVRKAPRWEIGWCGIEMCESASADGLFKTYAAKERIFQLHQDTFDLPSGAVHLARSRLCEGQAFRYGSNVYGLQFHLEVDKAMIHRWLKRPENQAVVRENTEGMTVEKIEAESEINIARSLELSRDTFGSFIDLFGLPEKNVLLGSSHGGQD